MTKYFQESKVIFRTIESHIIGRNSFQNILANCKFKLDTQR